MYNRKYGSVNKALIIVLGQTGPLMGLVRGGGGKELFKYIPARRPGHMTTEGVARLITYQRGDTIRVRDGFSPRFHDDCSHRALWRFISCRTLPSRPLSWSIPHTHSPPSKVFAIRILFCMKSAARCRWNNSPTFCGNYPGKARYEILLSPVSHYITTYLPSHKISQLFSARIFNFILAAEYLLNSRNLFSKIWDFFHLTVKSRLREELYLVFIHLVQSAAQDLKNQTYTVILIIYLIT